MNSPLTLSGKDKIPGDIALWFFLCAELAVFGLLIAGFSLVRLRQPEMFQAGLQELHVSAGVINTMALLTGSYLVATGVNKLRIQGDGYARYFFAASGCGMIYVISKVSEYQTLYSNGYSLHYDIFFGFYFFTTFFHFLHVLAGMMILIILGRWLKKTDSDDEQKLKAAESAASYWHMVDLVWIVLFPALYVLR
ncbi:MAG: cytochrome oxidase subunit III [Thalassolituus sp. CG17_big_fil_post_rev_8_21_14_2_50_53_8]|nr:MAG: cytochrome oxidase subunit III [Thalassolituus sp. CG17_big_fil_post_rev_8_21_14_2_50_53_8]